MRDSRFSAFHVFTCATLLFAFSHTIETAAVADQEHPVKDNVSAPAIIPRPNAIDVKPGQCALGDDVRIVIDGNADALRPVAEHAADVLAPVLGARPQIVEEPQPDRSHITIARQAPPGELGEEGYRLEITPSGVRIGADTPAGAFYGVQTLRQLLPIERPRDGMLALPCIEITDRPRYPWRGFMLDCSRHFMTKDFVMRTLDLMAMHKFNRFHWHLTDSQGWRLQIDRYPKLTQVGAARDHDGPRERPLFYSKDDVREIVAHAKARHIQVIPEIEMPGHCGAALAAYPELACEGAEGRRVAFCAGKEETFEFLFNVLDETCELFDASPIIHIGGDERPKGVWERCPRCQARMKELGITSAHDLQTWFMRRIADHLAKRDRRAISWAVTTSDPYNPTDMPDLGHDAIVQNWHGGASFAARQGWDVVNSDNRFVYFDYPTVPDATKPKWMPVLNLEKVYRFNPTPPDLSPDEARHILGGEACLWTELVPQEKVDSMMFPRLLALAEVMWTDQEKRGWDDFQKRVESHARRLESMRVAVPTTQP